jgi:hypothetical protein
MKIRKRACESGCTCVIAYRKFQPSGISGKDHEITSSIHCGTHGAGKSYPGLAIYVRYFVPLQLESHTRVIHLLEIFCTLAVGK